MFRQVQLLKRMPILASVVFVLKSEFHKINFVFTILSFSLRLE